MADHVFTITEIPTGGDPDIADLLGLRFEWTAEGKPITPFHGTGGGGARAAPVKPWWIPGHQQLVRTDYPSAKIPSFQNMGPRLDTQTFRGRFDDRYNGAGYAVFEARRFEEMCERGNPVRIAFGTRVYEGIIEKWQVDFGRSWKVPYEFTINVSNRPDQSDRSRVPETPADPTTTLNDVHFAVQAMLDVDDLAPRHAVAGTLADDVTSDLVTAVSAREDLASTIDQRDLNPPELPIDGFTRMATQFRAVRTAAFNLTVTLAEARSDLDMAVRGPMDVLDFEDWTRSLRYMARLSMRSAAAGERAATERAEPSAVRLYRPNAGEHLYHIARKFYGTPFAWRLIYDRNTLSSFTLDGTETLIIPERGGI